MNERELLVSYRPWLRVVAANMTNPARAEDLAQEGWIAIWRAVQAYDGSAPLDWWLKRRATDRMRDVLRGWSTNKARAHVLTDDVTELVELATELGAVEVAYHRGEIAAALARLSPREREYVHLRFWRGYRLPQMREHFGYPPHGLWRTAKAKLAADLAPLADLGVAA